MSRKIDRLHASSGRFLKENGKHINVADYLQELTNFFGQIQVAEKKSQLNLNSDLPLSDRRDAITKENGASVTKVGPEYRLRATTTTDSKAVIRTTQRGSYESGFVFEPGSGFRVDGTPTGTAYYKGGYAINGNAVNLVYDASGYKIQVINDGVETNIAQDDWNLDTLNGSADRDNPSGYNLNLRKGIVLESPFVYYGYGPIVVKIKITDEFGIERIVKVNQFNQEDKPSINEPNLPIGHEVFSGDGGTQLDLYLGGRQMSTWGRADRISRTVGVQNTVTGIGNSDWVPLISLKHKTGFKNIPVRFSGITFIPSDDIEYQITRQSTINSTNFITPENFVTAECATEWNTDGTFSTQADIGEAIYLDSASGGAKGVTVRDELPERPIYEEDLITLMVRSIGSSSITVKATFKVDEDW